MPRSTVDASDRSAEDLLVLARRMAMRWCRSVADADDIAQEALIHYVTQHPPPLNPSAWLFVVTRRLSHRRFLRERARNRAEEVFVFERVPADVTPDLLIDVGTVLSRLGPRDRKLLLSVLEGALSRDIALELDCNVRDVGQMVARARGKSRVLFRGRKEKS